MCQCAEGACSRINALIMREITAPPNVINNSGAYVFASSGCIVDITRSIVGMIKGADRFVTLSVRTITLGRLANNSMCCCKIGSGAWNPAIIITLGQRKNSSRRPWDVSGDKEGLSLRVLMTRCEGENSCWNSYRGSLSGILICTGPLRLFRDRLMASFTRRFACQRSSSPVIAVGSWKLPFTKLSSAFCWRMVWLSSWSIHSVGRSAEITMRGIPW